MLWKNQNTKQKKNRRKKMTANNPMIQVTNDLGITFNVRISYSDGEVLKDKDKMLVTFYDTRYKHDIQMNQF